MLAYILMNEHVFDVTSRSRCITPEANMFELHDDALRRLRDWSFQVFIHEVERQLQYVETHVRFLDDRIAQVGH